MNRARQMNQETPEERDTRTAGNFHQVERRLPDSLPGRDSGLLDYLSSFLGQKNPLAQEAHPDNHIVWLMDNTAYLTEASPHDKPMPWRAEVVACIFFKHGRKDAGKFVAAIADLIGLDGSMGMAEDEVVRRRIAERVQPFINSVAPSRTLTLEIPVPSGSCHTRRLNPSDRDGIITQTVWTGGHHITDRTVISPYIRSWNKPVTMETFFARPDGWAVISDVDDTVKYTQTSEAVGILRTTFAEEPRPIAGMPPLYAHIDRTLNPTWFYLSASPYNLYPFLRNFLRTFYRPGTLLLRDDSWMDLSGLLKSFSQGTHEYKVSRMERIRQWFPKRKILCIGDSTQTDPEAYADIYRRYPDWVRAIYIRKVTDVNHMESKNRDQRFEDAFDGVPRDIWTVFERPEDLYDQVNRLISQPG